MDDRITERLNNRLGAAIRNASILPCARCRQVIQWSAVHTSRIYCAPCLTAVVRENAARALAQRKAEGE